MGGEEFLVILPRTDPSGAVELAERIRAAVAATPMIAYGESISITVSGGCVTGTGDTVAHLLHRVDTLLYQAKHAGRDQIAAADLNNPHHTRRPSPDIDAT